MANFNKRVPENVPGEFFVDSTCLKRYGPWCVGCIEGIRLEITLGATSYACPPREIVLHIAHQRT